MAENTPATSLSLLHWCVCVCACCSSHDLFLPACCCCCIKRQSLWHRGDRRAAASSATSRSRPSRGCSTGHRRRCASASATRTRSTLSPAPSASRASRVCPIHSQHTAAPVAHCTVAPQCASSAASWHCSLAASARSRASSHSLWRHSCSCLRSHLHPACCSRSADTP